MSQIKRKQYTGHRIENNFELFKEEVDIVISNRIYKELDSVKHKLYTRDLFKVN